jgi:hypothetical protein
MIRQLVGSQRDLCDSQISAGAAEGIDAGIKSQPSAAPTEIYMFNQALKALL